MLDTIAYGRIASDIKVCHSKDNKHLFTIFLLASHDKNQTTFIRCVAFNSLATLLSNYFTKGDRIILKARIVSDNFRGSKYVFKLVVHDFEFVDTKAEHNQNVKKRLGEVTK